MLGLVFGGRVGGGFDGGILAPVLGIEPVDLGRGVNHGQPLEHGPHAVGQGLKGEILVGPERIPADRRDLQGIEDRAERRLFVIGHVAMPGAAEIALVRRLLPDLDDLGVGVHSFDLVMQAERAEPPGKGEMLLRRNVLAMEEDHEMIEQRLTDIRDYFVVEILREVDTLDLRAERRRDRFHAKTVLGQCSHRAPALFRPLASPTMPARSGDRR